MSDWVKSQRTKWILIAVAIAVAILLIGWWFFVFPYVSTDDARIAATLVRVAPESVGGRIIKLNVDVGSRVKQGDVLVELDHRIAAARLKDAQAQAEYTKRELLRITRLVHQGGLPQKDLDAVQDAADRAEAQLELAQVALEETTITSPINGIVVQKVIEVGDVVQNGQTLVTVADVDSAWVSANIEETDVGFLKIGQPVAVSVDAGGDLTGHVSEIRASTAAQFALIPAENPSGNFTKLVQRIPIKIVLDPHPHQELRAGESVEIKIRVR